MVSKFDLPPRSEPAWLTALIGKATPLLGGYAGTAIFGASTRVLSLGAQVLALFAMTWLMPKGDFGDMMTVFALYRITSYGIGAGCAAGILYHVSRDPTDENEVRTLRSFSVLGSIICLVVTALLIAGAHSISEIANKPKLAFWIYNLAPFGFLSTLVTLAAGAYDGRSRINHSIFLVEFLPNAFRVLLLGGLLVFHSSPSFVAYALALSMAPSCLMIIKKISAPMILGVRKISGWDIHYSSRFVLYSLLSMQLQGIDMVVVGYLYTSSQAADYAIAGRIAALFPFFQQIILKKFAPRCGYLISRGDMATLAVEARSCRISSVASVCLLTGLILSVAPFILRGAGQFTSALAMLVALAAPSYARAFFAGGEAILRMGGHANFSLMIMTGGFLFVVLTPLAAHHWIGVFALPLGMTLSALVLNPISVAKVRQVYGLTFISLPDIVALVGGLAIIFFAAYYATPNPLRWLVIGPLIALPGLLLLIAEKRKSFRLMKASA